MGQLLSPIERTGTLHDVRESGALVANWMRAEFANRKMLNGKLCVKMRGARRERYKQVQRLCEKIADLLVFTVETEPVGVERIPRYTALGHWEPRQRPCVDGYNARVYPLSIIMIDLKLGYHQRYAPFVLFSEHAMARLLMRSSATNLSELNDFVAPVVTSVFMSLRNADLPRDSFVLVTQDFYVPFAVVRGRPLAKTWVPRSDWTRPQTERLRRMTYDFRRGGGTAILDNVPEAVAGV
jgi:hypothetical protein